MTRTTSPSWRQPRSSLALLTAGVLVLLTAWFRQDPRYATAPPWYWQMKTEWKGVARVVLAGDSRVYRGLDPEVFSDLLGTSCVNFGFSSVGFDDRYMNAVEEVVDSRDVSPTIVLGVTAWSLTPLAAASNGFIDADKERAASLLPALWLARFDSVRHSLAPFDVELLFSNRPPSRATADNYIQTYHLNGWVESDYRTRNSSRGLEVARADHQAGNRVDPRLVRGLAERVVRWRSRGWLVFAYAPPLPAEVESVIAALSGFDCNEVAKELSAAGAIWLDEGKGLETYDGSHLTGESARSLSNFLAVQMQPHLNTVFTSKPQP